MKYAGKTVEKPGLGSNKHMKIITEPAELRQETEKLRCEGKQIGFVPTMGALHEGHLSLIRAAAAANDVTVCSIFVNPTQFNNTDDFKFYPRTLDEDVALLHTVECDILFAPGAAEMYPERTQITFAFGELEKVMEGAHRPGHFNGVATVVSKLFHLVQPHRAYFGQKDLQQFAVVRQLVADLSFDLELVRHPVVREADGLAMSSRNRRLTETERYVAAQLYQALQVAERLAGREPAYIKEEVSAFLSHFPQIELEYFEVADANTLQPLHDWPASGEVAFCLAVQLGAVRLIDNVVVGAN